MRLFDDQNSGSISTAEKKIENYHSFGEIKDLKNT